VRRYAVIVLVTVVVVTAFVGGFDAVFGILSGWLYND
jgi:preprotein translocase subunit SecE